MDYHVVNVNPSQPKTPDPHPSGVLSFRLATYVVALVAFSLHGLFHVLERASDWRQPNFLSPMFSSDSPFSYYVHVVVELVIGAALIVAFVGEILAIHRRRSP